MTTTSYVLLGALVAALIVSIVLLVLLHREKRARKTIEGSIAHAAVTHLQGELRTSRDQLWLTKKAQQKADLACQTLSTRVDILTRERDRAMKGGDDGKQTPPA